MCIQNMGILNMCILNNSNYQGEPPAAHSQAIGVLPLVHKTVAVEPTLSQLSDALKPLLGQVPGSALEPGEQSTPIPSLRSPILMTQCGEYSLPGFPIVFFINRVSHISGSRCQIL
jgi:hypothetical protein